MKTNQNCIILYWIKKSKAKNGEAPIYCRITVDGQRTELSIKRTIHPSKWISSVGIAKGTSEQTRTLNVYLDYVKAEILKHYNQLVLAGKPTTPEAIKNSYLGIKEEERTLIEVFKYHNEQLKALIDIDVTKATHTKFNTILSKMELFLKSKYKMQDIRLSDLNNKFITDFEYFLKTNQKIGHNTTMKYIQGVKKIILMSVANDWLDKNPFRNFKCTHKRVVREILTNEELSIMANKTFASNRLEEVRDVFLFCCYTGYAFIDVEKLTENHLVTGIDGCKWIYTSRQKTGIKANVPLLQPAEAIIKKYKNDPYCKRKGKLLPVKSNQKMNEYLKEIAEVCGIKKKLSMHIARHTFATTVTLSNGVPIETVSTLLGHTRLATTQIYAKVLENKVSEDMNRLKDKLNFMGKSATGS